MLSRKQIVEKINVKSSTITILDELKSCLILDETKNQDIDCIDEFLYGIIASLFYKPNKNMLVIVCKDAEKPYEFIKDIFPKDWESDCINNDIYSCLIIDASKSESINFNNFVQDILMSDCFKVLERKPYPRAEKRLASICLSTNNAKEKYISVNSSITIYLKDIDLIKFRSIDKELMWIEIYNRLFNFDIFSQQEIENFFS